jgi:hypothetical protein
MHIHDLQAYQNIKFNVSHSINRLSFGADYPGIVNPLDGVIKVEGQNGTSFPFVCVSHQINALCVDPLAAAGFLVPGADMWMYYAKVVPTSYHYRNGEQHHVVNQHNELTRQSHPCIVCLYR